MSELVPPIGLLQAIVEAIGEADNEIGGLFSTRLTAPTLAGALTLPVESTIGWQPSGRIAIEGQFYTYDSLSPTTLDGIKRDNNGVIVPGTAFAHRDESEVVDLTRARSALDLVRRALLVDYAEGDDLNTLGRNLNVLRSPFLGDDSRFRKIVKALAYNPRGTMYGLELALDGLVDPGNYEIFEDLINFPCTVFIRLTGAATTEDISAGKAFLNSGVAAPPTSDTTVDLPSAPLQVQNVLWKDENGSQPATQGFKPSGASHSEYDGQPLTPIWTFVGTNEGTDVVLTPGQYTEMIDPGVADITTYERIARLQPESNADFELLMAVPTTGTYSAAVGAVKQWYLAIRDTVKELAVGILNIDASTYLLGFTSGSGHIGTTVTLQKNTFYSIGIHKRGSNDVELTVNGTIASRVAYSSFGASADHKFVFGCGATGFSGARGRIKRIEFHATTLTDYWNSRGTAADVNTGDPDEIDVNVPGHFSLAEDPGKQFETRGSTVTNGQGGNNNGRWIIAGVSSSETADLIGETFPEDATVSNANPTRITVATPKAFQFPDDLGKEIQIMGSGLGNDGTFVIDKLLDPDTLVDLQAALTQLPSRTNVCEVVGGAFVTESGLDWRLHPNFLTEAGLDWELSDAGSVAGVTLTLRQPLPLAAGVWRVLNIIYTDVLSGQVVQDNTIENAVTDEGPPPLYDYYPFYVSDPLGFVRSYLDAITAAGVIPEFLIV